jgi:hypothetical protein
MSVVLGTVRFTVVTFKPDVHEDDQTDKIYDWDTTERIADKIREFCEEVGTNFDPETLVQEEWVFRLNSAEGPVVDPWLFMQNQDDYIEPSDLGESVQQVIYCEYNPIIAQDENQVLQWRRASRTPRNTTGADVGETSGFMPNPNSDTSGGDWGSQFGMCMADWTLGN